MNGEAVEIQAFRGSRRRSVYRKHVLSVEAFGRILATGERMALSLLSSLDVHGPRELDKRQAAQLASELTSIRTTSELPEFDGDLTAIAEVARWCSHATEGSWLRIEGT
jgi:hypothetical protein